MNQNNSINLFGRINIINDNIENACKQINKKPSDIMIVAVTKNVDTKIVNSLLTYKNSGISYIGENRVQEFISKYNDYCIKNNNIHFIGHLQTNKVKYIIDKVSMIESVDSIKLACEIDKLSKMSGIIMDILLEVNIENEPSKSGFTRKSIFDGIVSISALDNVRIKGLMCVPPKENYVKSLEDMHDIFLEIDKNGIEKVDMQYLSTGMSQCYVDAILNGSNIIRLGSALFR